MLRDMLRWFAAYLAALLAGSWTASLIIWLVPDPRPDTLLTEVVYAGLFFALISGVVLFLPTLLAVSVIGTSRDWRRYAILGALAPSAIALLFVAGDLRDAPIALGLTLPSGALGGLVFHQVWTRMEAKA